LENLLYKIYTNKKFTNLTLYEKHIKFFYEFEYEQSEEVNSLLVCKLALEVELEIEREFI
jgi:hypothetical protein